MMGRFRVLVLGVLCATSPVLAQPKPTPPTDAQKQQAGDLVKKAIAKSQAGEHEAAIKLYLDAFVIVPNPILLSNVGAEYQQAQKTVEALKYFCMYLEKDPTGTNASYATAQAKVLQTQLGITTEVCVKPEPVKPAPPPPTVVEPPPPTVTGTEQPFSPPPNNAGSTLRLAGLGVAGAGLVSFGAGIYFGTQAQKHSDVITNHDKNLPYTAEELESEVKGPAAEKKQIIFTVAGGVLTAAGVVVYFVGRSKRGSSETSVSLTPTATPDAVGVTLGGGF